MIQLNKDKKKLYQYVQEHREDLRKMDRVEMMAALVALGEQKRLAKMLEEEETEEFDVCIAIDELLADGREEGRKEGEQRVNQLIQCLIKQSRMEDILKMSKDSQFQMRLFEEFGL